MEDIVYLPDRKLSRDRVARYASCKWVEGNEVLVIISKTGCGKSYLCQALGNSACRHLHGVTYTRMADMFMELNRARAHADGSYFEKMDRLKTVKLLIVDDFMTTPISTQDAVDLFEIMEAREVSIGAIRHFEMALAISRMSLLALSSSVLLSLIHHSEPTRQEANTYADKS